MDMTPILREAVREARSEEQRQEERRLGDDSRAEAGTERPVPASARRLLPAESDVVADGIEEPVPPDED